MDTVISASPEVPVVPSDPRTMEFLRKNGYSGLTGAFIKDISYLEQLSTTTSQPIKDWEVIELLRPVPRGDKRAINKVFFKQVEDKKAVIDEIDAETFQRIQRAMFDTAERRKAAAVSNAMYKYRNSFNSIREWEQRLQSSIDIAREAWLKWQEVEGLTPADYMGEVRKILKNPFFTFQRFALSTAYFVTTNEAIMNYTNAAAGIRHQVNFGKIQIMLDLSHNRLSAGMFENNLIMSQGYYHPFISRGGEICFGASANTVHRYMTEGKFSDIFDILAALLVTYDGGSSPYIDIGTFEREEKTRTAIRQTPRLCGDCGQSDQSCSCPICGWCDQKGHRDSECPTRCFECHEHKDNCTCADALLTAESEATEIPQDCTQGSCEDCTNSECGCECHA